VATNQFHKWAHQENPSAFARWLQRKRLVLEPAHHQRHHTRPFDVNYCITNGWLNPVLNRLKFFRRLEARSAFSESRLPTAHTRKASFSEVKLFSEYIPGREREEQALVWLLPR